MILAIYDLYSKRKEKREKPAHDVYIYDSAPITLRHQLAHILNDAFHADSSNAYRAKHFRLNYNDFSELVRILRREYGVEKLHHPTAGIRDELTKFILTCTTDQFLDCAEITCLKIERDSGLSDSSIKSHIHEINFRLREAGLGYEYISPQMIRIDDRLLHAEVLKPVIHLLSSDPIFAGAEDELFAAFDHFKRGEHKEAISNALKSFESCMKTILQKRGWCHKPTDTASKLIVACLTNELIPSYMQTHFTGLRTLLETGVPVIRNKESSHGQGAEPKDVPDHLVSYVLYTAAANIKLLVECDAKLD